MAKTALAAIGICMVAAMAALTITFSSGPQAHGANTLGGAGVTVTWSAAPPTIDTPSAAPKVKAKAFSPGIWTGAPPPPPGQPQG